MPVVVLMNALWIIVERSRFDRFDDFINGMQLCENGENIGATEMFDGALSRAADNHRATIQNGRNHSLMTQLVRLFVVMIVFTFGRGEGMVSRLFPSLSFHHLPIGKNKHLIKPCAAEMRAYRRAVIRSYCNRRISEIHCLPLLIHVLEDIVLTQSVSMNVEFGAPPLQDCHLAFLFVF
jgi:hypothetical protein